MDKQVLFVAAALIRDGERFLIARRPETKSRPLLWEFVGGKLEPGETGQEALVRECREELGVTVSVGEMYMHVVHAYPDVIVDLTLYETTIIDGVPQLLEHRGLCFITPQEIPLFAFCPADRDILARLSEEGTR